MDTTALILAIILFITGLLGTVLPLLPGTALIYAGFVLYGFMTKFVTLDITFYILQGLALILVFIIDYVASAAGTRRFGGSKQAAWGAVIGAVIGLFLGPLGIIIGPFVGAVGIELLRGIEINQAVRVGFGTLIGFIGGTFLKLGVGILMIVYFFIRVL